MVMVTIDIPSAVNKMVEHFKVEHELKDKREAIVMILKSHTSMEVINIEDMFKEANNMRQVKLPTKEIVKMKREVYA